MSLLKTKLYSYQEYVSSDASKRVKENDCRHFAILFKPGRGKTLTALALIDNLFSLKEIDSAIIISPKSVLDTWEKQISVHSFFDNVLRWPGSASLNKEWKERASKLFEKDLPIFLLNVEAFQTNPIPVYIDQILKKYQLRKVIVIVDESTTLKSHDSKRFKTANQLFLNYKVKAIMTGTVRPNSINDFWSQYEFLKKNFWQQKTFYIFDRTYNVKIPQYTAGGVIRERNMTKTDVKVMYEKIKEKVEKVKELEKNPNISQSVIATTLAKIEKDKSEAAFYESAFIHKEWLQNNVFDQIKYCSYYADDVRDLPESVEEEVFVEMTREEKKAYKDMKQTLMTMIDEKLFSVTEKSSLFHKFRQIVGGSFDSETFIEGNASKVRAILDDISDHNEKVLIICNYVSHILLMGKALEEAGYGFVYHYGAISANERRENIEKAVNDDDIRFIVANSSTIGTGVDGLQKSFHVMYFYDLPLKPIEWEQTKARILREGQKESCLYKIFLSKDSLDERCLSLLKDKEDAQSAFDMMAKKDWVKYI